MREIFLPGVVLVYAVARLWADVVDEDLEVHLRFSAKTLYIGQEVTLVGTDRTAQGVVIVKGGAEAERKDSRTIKAAGDHAGVIAGSGLSIRTGQTSSVFVEMLGDDDGQIGCGKEEDLVSEEPGDPSEGHRAAVTG
jgi:hypothetical protein